MQDVSLRGLPAMMAVLASSCFFLMGCVSSSAFGEFRDQTQQELSALEADISTVRSEMTRIVQSQRDLDSDVREWLSASEAKLAEMEDRVIEIRLLLRRTGVPERED